jgi:hypothetical protein
MEAGRLQNLEALTAHIQNLEALRDERFAEEDGPAIEELRRRAMLASVGSKSAERLRRYETGHALDLHRSLGALMKLRKDAANRPAEIDGTSWGPEVSEPFAPAPNEANAAGVSAPNEANGGAPNEAKAAEDASVEPPAAAAPNEAKPAGWVGSSCNLQVGYGDAPAPTSAPDLAMHEGPDAPTAGPEGV